MSILPTETPQVSSSWELDLALKPDKEIQTARVYFEQLVPQQIGISDYFRNVKQNLLIIVKENVSRIFANEIINQIDLSFAQPPRGKSVEPIKHLSSYEGVSRHRTYASNEFQLGFPKVYDLKGVAWALAMEYRRLGYTCRIDCRTEAEVIDVEELIANAIPSAIWRQLETVPSSLPIQKSPDFKKCLANLL